MELLHKWWDVYGHKSNTIFSLKGLLEEPTTKEAIAKHKPIIVAFNNYIETACEIRTQSLDWKEYEAAFEE